MYILLWVIVTEQSYSKFYSCFCIYSNFSVIKNNFKSIANEVCYNVMKVDILKILL